MIVVCKIPFKDEASSNYIETGTVWELKCSTSNLAIEARNSRVDNRRIIIRLSDLEYHFRPLFQK
jgi:hypothetical protein